jgi:hypothetical protein
VLSEAGVRASELAQQSERLGTKRVNSRAHLGNVRKRAGRQGS